MSNKVLNTDIQTNEEIIDELTQNIESQRIQDELLSNSDNEHIPEDDTASNDSEVINPEDPECDQKDMTDNDDYVDEEALKDLETTLTDDQKIERKQQSIDLKNKGNDVFKAGNHLESLKIYTEGLNLCPLSFSQVRAMLYSNRAASKAKLGRTESAIEDCTKAIDLDENYIRALLRRAQLYEQTDKLDEALADYQKVLTLDPSVQEAQRAAIRLPPLIAERNEKMKEEMMGKLKDLGNMFLRPFGLSTENFKLQQDPNTGGYSVNFQQNK